MLYKMVRALISLTENFVDKHAVIQSLETTKSKSMRPGMLQPMSPGHLFRKPGLNITTHKKIMKKNGIANTR